MKTFEGWKMICECEVYIEDGCIVRGLGKDHNGQPKPTYPYRKSRFGGWDNCSPISVSSFKAGFKRGTVAMI